MPWVLRGLREGIVTSRYPDKNDSYGNNWHGHIRITSPDPRINLDPTIDNCPTAAIRTIDGKVEIDHGLCIMCGRCVERQPDVFSFSPGFETTKLARALLIAPDNPEDISELGETRDNLSARVKQLRRSVHVRHVDCGSDGSEEWEIAALLNPIYDVQRLGIFFTPSPRHADILLVTGAGSSGMLQPLQETYRQMPNPKIVVAVGTDAISGGMHANSYATGINGITEAVPVDVFVPGSPPSPFAILYGILLGLGLVLDRGTHQ